MLILVKKRVWGGKRGCNALSNPDKKNKDGKKA
jgi:hypothetical protein